MPECTLKLVCPVGSLLSLLLQEEVEDGELDRALRRTNLVRSKLIDFSKRFEEANEKLSDAVRDSESKTEQAALAEGDQELIEFLGSVTDSISEVNAHHADLNTRRSSITSETSEIERQFQRLSELQSEVQQQTQQLLTSQRSQLDELHRQRHPQTTSCLKLPKLEITTFNGNILTWSEFWDSFEVAVHENTNLSSVEKLTYLKSNLSGDALTTISGLSVCNENYPVAIKLLKERFGNKQMVISAIYNDFMNLPVSSNNITKLRHLYDTIERHLRSLEAHAQDVTSQILVSMITSKLPRDVLVQLELKKNPETNWTVANLRDMLKSYIMAREAAERQSNQTSNKQQESSTSTPQYHYKPSPMSTVRSSAEALVVNQRQSDSPNNFPKSGCYFCGKKHWSDECQTYTTIESRKLRVRGQCYICLRKNHLLKDCDSDKPCFYCKQRKNHHRSLCPKQFPSTKSTDQELSNIADIHPSVGPNKTQHAMVASGEVVLLQTATTSVRNPKTFTSQSVRVLLDSGSHRTYITEHLVKQLKLKVGECKEEISVSTFGSENPQIIRTPTVSLEIQLKDMTFMTITANVVPKITGAIHRSPVDLRNCQNWRYLWKDITLADSYPSVHETSILELLIGNDYYLDFVLPEKIKLNPGLYLLGSRLGWLLSGRTSTRYEKSHDVNMLVLSFGNHVLSAGVMLAQPDKSIPLTPNLEDFGNLESLGITDSGQVTDNDKALDRFNKTVTMKDNRYQVTWPWKCESPELPENKELALGRLKSLSHRLRNSPDLLERYHSIIQEQENLDIIEKVTEPVSETRKHYIPHHAVITPSKATTKVRMVYDASAKSKPLNKSLNECLYRGPVILQDLCGLLLRFRLYHVGIIADIEKAFLQVGLQIDQRDITRFFWLKEPQKPLSPENIEVYRFTRVPFGIISSPFLLGATILHHLNKIGNDTASKLRQALYVDNVITGCNSTEESIAFYHDAKQVFNSASMNLREWASNNPDFLQQISEKDLYKKEIIKVLGLIWDTTNDMLNVVSPPTTTVTEVLTKREVLSVTSSVFDPLGIVSPITLSAKLYMQKLWTENVGWDVPLSDDNRQQWISICQVFDEIPRIIFPRFIGMKISDCTDIHLICFCDASMKAYSAAVYLRLSSSDNCAAKARLAPIKTVTLPRLELLAVLIGVRCLNFVQNQLGIGLTARILYTDSQCVLHWISSTKSLPAFVSNRITEIKSQSDIRHHYVPTESNPADYATRGQFDSKRQLTPWLCGPEWLKSSPDAWPSWNISDQDDHHLETQVSTALYGSSANKPVSKEISSPFGISSSDHSTLTKLLRVTAWCVRFVRKLKRQGTESGFLTVDELKNSKFLWERYVQHKNYQAEMSALQQNKGNNLCIQLGLQLDKQGLIRCAGRLENAQLSQACKLPKLLPPKDPFTRLVILDRHLRILHSGTSQTLAALRQEYWVLRGSATVRAVTKQCGVCNRFDAGPFKMPQMPPLPKQRVSQSQPFSYTGLDYFGPLYVKTDSGKFKVWVCLFTCLAVRAIHLELINDMSADKFLLCFRRFVAIHGIPKRMISDNASQFKLAKTVIDKAWSSLLSDPDVQNYMTTQGIGWNFTVQLAPWMGGFYERLVGVVKRCLRKTIGFLCLTADQLQTTLTEVQAIINSRPLVYVDEDINSQFAITPNHFISHSQIHGIPSIENDGDPDFQVKTTATDRLLTLWKKGQKLLDRFWDTWRNDYLLSLRERTETHLKSPRIQTHYEPKAGDVVLLKENLPRAAWKIGRIQELQTSWDGKIRSAEGLLPSKSTLNRPLSLLYPLECHGPDEISVRDLPVADSLGTTDGHPHSMDSPGENRRPTREAAAKAREKLKSCLTV